MAEIAEAHLLFETAALYKRLSKRNYRVTLADGTRFEIRFPPWAYHHLVGLHKFNDIAEATVNKAMGRSQISIYNDILRRRLTEYDLQPSVHYDDDVVPGRLRAFMGIEGILNNASKAAFPFDRKALKFSSSLNADMLMFRLTYETNSICYYMHLFFKKVESEGYYAPVSFFETDDDRYLHGQKCHDVASVEFTEHCSSSRKEKRNDR